MAAPFQTCPLCSGPVHPAFNFTELKVSKCSDCRHYISQAERPTSEEDYHHQYEQGEYLFALEKTRHRQAQIILAGIQHAFPEATALADIGCGRGWFLKSAKASFQKVAGLDTSDLAVESARAQGAEAVRLSDLQMTEGLKALSFRPDLVTFLDVIEHFEIEELKTEWRRLKEMGISRFVVKVPLNTGFFFRLASLFYRVGASAPLRQLFQVGTYPPHLQYFSLKSARLLADQLGLTVVDFQLDEDIEADSFSQRIAALKKLPKLSRFLGKLTVAFIRILRWQDSAILYLKSN